MVEVPGPVGGLLEKKLMEMANWWEKVKKRFHNFSRNNMELAEFHLSHGHYTDAMMRFRMVLWKDPSSAHAWAGLAYASGMLEDKEEALEAARKALTLYSQDWSGRMPSTAGTWAGYAYINEILGNRTEAEDAARKALDIYSKNEMAQKVLEDLKQWEVNQAKTESSSDSSDEEGDIVSE